MKTRDVRKKESEPVARCKEGTNERSSNDLAANAHRKGESVAIDASAEMEDGVISEMVRCTNCISTPESRHITIIPVNEVEATTKKQ